MDVCRGGRGEPLHIMGARPSTSKCGQSLAQGGLVNTVDNMPAYPLVVNAVAARVSAVVSRHCWPILVPPQPSRPPSLPCRASGNVGVLPVKDSCAVEAINKGVPL